MRFTKKRSDEMLYDMRRDEAGNLGQVSIAKPGEMFEAGRFPSRRMFYFFRVLYRICNPILLSIMIFNPPTLTLLQVFYCDADCKSLY